MNVANLSMNPFVYIKSFILFTNQALDFEYRSENRRISLMFLCRRKKDFAGKTYMTFKVKLVIILLHIYISFILITVAAEHFSILKN